MFNVHVTRQPIKLTEWPLIDLIILCVLIPLRIWSLQFKYQTPASRWTRSTVGSVNSTGKALPIRPPNHIGIRGNENWFDGQQYFGGKVANFHLTAMLDWSYHWSIALEHNLWRFPKDTVLHRLVLEILEKRGSKWRNSWIFLKIVGPGIIDYFYWLFIFVSSTNHIMTASSDFSFNFFNFAWDMFYKESCIM